MVSGMLGSFMSGAVITRLCEHDHNMKIMQAASKAQDDALELTRSSDEVVRLHREVEKMYEATILRQDKCLVETQIELANLKNEIAK